MRLSNWVIICVLCGLLSLPGCKGAAEGDTSGGGPLQTQDLVGRWTTAGVKVELKSVHGTRRDSSFVINPTGAVPGFECKPPLTILMPTGTYQDEVRTLSDSLLRKQEGTWHLFQDTVYFRIENNTGAEIKYHARRKGKSLFFSSRVDWDGDGRRDDAMRVELKQE